jgi:glycosyltransferase involved in cell wall biosynthesis
MTDSRAERQRFSVVIPSYRRPAALSRCLTGLASQDRPADEVIVVRRGDDPATAETALACDRRILDVVVEEPGVVAAMTAGARAAIGEVIVFIDDDAVPHADWLARMSRWYGREDVGGVGGRDLVYAPGEAREVVALGGLTDDVGRVTGSGRLIGNHHRGAGPGREVDVLKGVNASFRREALALPSDLRGAGAQVHWEVASCLWARRQGWRLIYDPAILVDHFPAGRPAGDLRSHAPARITEDAVYNQVMAILSFEPRLFWRRGLYGLLVGDGGDPGVARALAGVLRRDREAVRRLPASLRGQVRALMDFRRGRRLQMLAINQSRPAATPA